MNSKVLACLKLCRPVNILIGAATIFVGVVLTQKVQPLMNVVLACASGSLIMAAGNALNDVFDREIDRINKPQRPIPSGELTPEGAAILSVILFVSGIYLSILINFWAMIIAVFASLVLFLYDAFLKRVCCIGNVLVSLLTAFAFLYGAVAVGKWHTAIFPASFAFLFHLGREIIKDVEDEEGDKVYSAKTLPIKYGKKVALLTATVVYVLLIILTFVPYYYQIYNQYYFWIVLFGVDMVLAATFFFLWRFYSKTMFQRISVVLKADMVVGLLAIYVGI